MANCCGIEVSDKVRCWTCIIISLIFVTILCVLIGVSIQSLSDNQVGLEYDENSYVLNDKEIFTNGRYFIGPGHKFFKFDKSLQEIHFQVGGDNQLDVRTIDGLSVIIDVSFTYRLQDTLYDILSIFHNFTEGNYEEKYILIARNSIRDTASKYTAFELFYNKTFVALDMREELDEAFKEYWALVEQFQFTDAYLPAGFDTAILETENSVIAIDTARNNKNQTEAEVQGEIYKAEEEVQVILNEYEAFVYEIEQNAVAQTNTFSERMDNEREVMKNLKSQLSLNGQQVIDYIWINTLNDLMESDNVNIVANLPKPDALNCALGGCN